jgi:hypothetical protein
MTFRGAWVTGYGYATNDAVSYGGSTYIATVSNNSAEPDTNSGNGGAWSLLAQAGSTGPAGPAGAAATVSVGTTTTGAPGSSASVTNAGSSSAAILNFTIPQGATGPAGSGGSGGGGGFSGVAVYHSVQNNLNYPYYSVNNPNSSATEYGLTAASYSALTWVPAGCTATALNVYSEQTNAITVTLRVGPAPSSMADTTLVCSSVTIGTPCSVTGSVAVSAGSFVDLSISGADSSPAAVWTALTCN